MTPHPGSRNPSLSRFVRACAGFAILAMPARTEAQAATWKSEYAALERTPGPLVGTLVIPAGSGRLPLAIILSGSGPTDRDGNTAGTESGPNSLKMLAEGLAARGIASLRYDKRGIGASSSAALDEHDQRFDSLANDAVEWVRKYRADPRFGFITIVGHSEGSLLGMLATQRAPADAFVSIAGPARRADKVLLDQLTEQLPPNRVAEAERVLNALAAGNTYENAPIQLYSLFRWSVQPYWISWLRYTGAEEIAKLTVPVLIVQGSTDLQVAPFEADLLARAQPAAKVLRIAGMNHVLKMTSAGRAEQMASYADPSQPIAPGLVEGIAAFIREAARTRK